MRHFTAIHIDAAPGAERALQGSGAILQRRVAERSGLTAAIGRQHKACTDELRITLALEPGIGAEGFCVSTTADNHIRIAGNDERGLLYGIGKFLRTSRYAAGQFAPSEWRGTAVPDCHVRGMYFAFHNNFYPNAPHAELYRYMEDLALWGLNSLVFHLAPNDDHNAVASTAQRDEHRALLREAKRLGFRIGLLASPNIGLESAPKEILGPEFPDTTPARRGFSGARVCPSQPAGFAYLSKLLDEYLAGYEDIGLDYVVAFPYDSGGCGCPDCWPWGARGYVKISREFARLARKRYPQVKFVLGTWCFDVRDESDGEYEGLARVLAEDRGWADYIMDDSHYDFPRYPLDHGVPGGLPLVNFAEISMWGRFPWGGSGANPLPARFQDIWDQSGHALDGGFPYSEGKFEDINKFIFSQFFWKRGTKAADAVREYVAYEYAPEVADAVTEAIYLLERTYPRATQQRADVLRACELLQQADPQLPERARQAWRWRILYLRAVIDCERLQDGNVVSERCDAAYEELIRISHLETGWCCVTPRSRAYLAREAKKNQAAAPLPPGSTPQS